MKHAPYPFAAQVLSMPRPLKRVVAIFVDCSLCVLTVWLAYYLRLGEFVYLMDGGLVACAVSIVIAIPLFIVSGLYRAIFRYSGFPALVAIARAVALYGLMYASIFTMIGIVDVPRTVGIIQPLLLLMFVGLSRLGARLWLDDQYRVMRRNDSRPKVLIYGAGGTGRQLAAALANSHEMKVVGFLDDDDRLHGHVLNGMPIYAPEDLTTLAEAQGIKDVLLAMPNIGRKRRNEILARIQSGHVSVRTLPRVTDLAQGRVSISDLRDLDIDDLLLRDPVSPNQILMSMNVFNKVVAVTGAGGSIGSELCRQILQLKPAKLLLIEQCEFKLYAINSELEEKKGESDVAIIALLASVQDKARMWEIMGAWRPDTVYHAAAYKHVPIVERNPAEGIKNNVLGTLCAAQAAAHHRVSDFVLVSTDKAVRPPNIMGASKRLAEMILQALAQKSPHTTFSMVRFGNVLGSSGSVVPLFRQQIRAGGPITLTHPEVTRYFMTIPEAAQLVIQAGAMAKGGEVFVLDMGEPVKIMDLARQMIELSGLTIKDEDRPDGDIEISIMGLRPGEKLYEELLIGDNPQGTSHPRIMKAHEAFLPWDELETGLSSLRKALEDNDVSRIRLHMQKMVTGYRPQDEIVDWVFIEKSA